MIEHNISRKDFEGAITVAVEDAKAYAENSPWRNDARGLPTRALVRLGKTADRALVRRSTNGQGCGCPAVKVGGGQATIEWWFGPFAAAFDRDIFQRLNLGQDSIEWADGIRVLVQD